MSRKYDIPIGKKKSSRESGTCSMIRFAPPEKKICFTYHLLLVSIPTLIKQQIVNNTPIGNSMKPYVTRQSLGKTFFFIRILSKNKDFFLDRYSSG